MAAVDSSDMVNHALPDTDSRGRDRRAQRRCKGGHHAAPERSDQFHVNRFLCRLIKLRENLRLILLDYE
jgi:hypothetical protein